jgi:hypothetical protein
MRRTFIGLSLGELLQAGAISNPDETLRNRSAILGTMSLT